MTRTIRTPYFAVFNFVNVSRHACWCVCVCGGGGGGGGGGRGEHARTHLLITILASGLRQTSAVQYCLKGKSQSLSVHYAIVNA